MHITLLRSNRATLIPQQANRQVRSAMLHTQAQPTARLKATSTDRAEAAAHDTTGLAVLCVDRVGGGE